jgi:hypothetical protein
MTVSLWHTPAEGTLALGTDREMAPIFKQAGFRWSRNIGFGGAWYVPNSRDRAPQLARIEQCAEALRSAGWEVEVSIDTETRSAADVEAARYDRLEQRQAALDAKAVRLAGQSTTAWEKSRAIAEMIPFGQPILVGHHSEGRHRRDIARIQGGMDRSIQLQREADEAARRAAASRAEVAHRETVPATLRRIERAEVELRQVNRALDGASADASPAWSASMLTRKAELEGRLEWDREKLAQLEAAGAKVFGPADFAKGDRVKGSGHWATVERVNAKSLSLRYDVMPQFTRATTYDKITKP